MSGKNLMIDNNEGELNSSPFLMSFVHISIRGGNMKKKLILLTILWHIILFIFCCYTGKLFLFFIKLVFKMIQLAILSRFIEVI